MTTKPEPTPHTPSCEPLRLDTSPGQTYEGALAKTALDGKAGNALTASRFAANSFGQLGINESISVLQEAIDSVQRGETNIVESMLVSQAIALDSIFTELCRRASINMGEHLDATERYMRLALKAQNQCRTTLESLAVTKSPPVVYAQQANISSGHQQVNNNQAKRTIEESPSEQTVEQCATGQTGTSHTGLAPLGTLDRTQDIRRFGAF